MGACCSQRRRQSLLTLTHATISKQYQSDIPGPITIDGREYFLDPNVRYFMPLDEAEIGRTKLEHDIYKLVWGDNFSSPSRSYRLILDIGCGAGHWSIEWARELPNKTFIGVDAFPFFEEEDEKPPNFGFIQCNVYDGLPFPENTFDYVFQRNLSIALVEKHYKAHFEEITRVMKPGGKLVIEDAHFSPNTESETLKYYINAFWRFIEGAGSSEDSLHRIPKYLKKNGNFTRIKSERVPIPLGKWGGSVGMMALFCVRELFIAMKPVLKIILGSKDDSEFSSDLDMFIRELNKNQTSYNVYRVSARYEPQELYTQTQ